MELERDLFSPLGLSLGLFHNCDSPWLQRQDISVQKSGQPGIGITVGWPRLEAGAGLRPKVRELESLVPRGTGLVLYRGHPVLFPTFLHCGDL